MQTDEAAREGALGCMTQETAIGDPDEIRFRNIIGMGLDFFDDEAF